MTGRREADEQFVSFVTRAYPGLVRFGAFLVGERPGGEDLAQTALMKVYGSWAQLNDEAAAGAYTRKAMVRLAQRGRRRRWSSERPTLIQPNAVRTHDRTDDLAIADQVRGALARLPVAQRAVLVLRYFEMRSEDEIAGILDISAGTVKSRAARGLAALRGMDLLKCDQALEEDVP